MTYRSTQRVLEQAAVRNHILAHGKTIPRPVVLLEQEIVIDDYRLCGSVWRKPDGRIEVYVAVRRRASRVEVWWWPRPVKGAAREWARDLAERHGAVDREWETSGTYCASVPAPAPELHGAATAVYQEAKLGPDAPPSAPELAITLLGRRGLPDAENDE